MDTSSINLRPTEGGVIIPVKVVPGASRDKVAGVLGDCVKITTSSAADQALANAAVAKTLAKALGVSPRDVTLVAGQTNPRTDFLVAGLSLEQCRQRLAE